MPRYHVHCNPSGDAFEITDPVITVSIWAHNDGLAEKYARALVSVPVDVQEIELAEEEAA